MIGSIGTNLQMLRKKAAAEAIGISKYTLGFCERSKLALRICRNQPNFM
jgi:DNA-binding XRE family transcriptional regulator